MTAWPHPHRAKADAVSRDEEVSHLRSELKVTQGRLNAVEKVIKPVLGSEGVSNEFGNL